MKTFILTVAYVFFSARLLAGTINIKHYGAKGDGKNDDTKAIQTAINAAPLSIKTVIYFPAGIYNIASFITTGNYFENYSILLHSNLHLKGDGDKTIIRVGDHIFDKNDTSANAHLFYGRLTQNITFSNLIIDLNGANNLVPPNVIKNHSAIFTAHGSNYYIHDITIKNCAGTNMLNIMGEGRMLLIENCNFFNGGNYVGSSTANANQYDFSFVYSEWDSTIVRNNIIRQDDLDIGLGNHSGGIELHGSRSSATNNFFDGCWPAIYISSSTHGLLSDVVVQNNQIINCVTGISFWVEYPMKNIFIYNNEIRLTHTRVSILNYCTGISVPNGNAKEYSNAKANGAPVFNLRIIGNTIDADTMKSLSYAMILHSLHESVIQDNIITGMNCGGILLTGSKWGIDSLDVNNNTFNDFMPNNDKNAVAGYFLFSDTYSAEAKDAPGFQNITFRNNSLLRSNKNEKYISKNKGTGLFFGAFVDVPSKMINNIRFKNNIYTNASEKTYTVNNK